MIGKILSVPLIAVLAIGISDFSSVSNMSTASAASTGKSGLPLPRYVSIKSKRVNMRVGPGKQYRVDWLYQKQGLPLEIIQEFDNWRKVRDAEGNEGWILHSLLSGRRTAIVTPWDLAQKARMTDVLEDSEVSGSVIAKLEPGVVTTVQACDKTWCKIQVEGVEGFVSKQALWGVYPDETIEE